MQEIRIHGRGGQGAVTAAELIALAAFHEGREAQAFPSFGVERSGAPVQAFARISDSEIITRSQIYSPDILIIQDESLLALPETLRGKKSSTIGIINSRLSAQELLAKWHIKNWNRQLIKTIPASDIALKQLGKNIINTALLGAFAKAAGLLSISSLFIAVKEKFADKGTEIINKNLAAVQAAYAYESLEEKK